MLKMAKRNLQKFNVTLMIFLSIITLGIYPIFWVYKKNSEFQSIKSEHIIPSWFLHCYSSIWGIGLVLYSLFLSGLFDLDDLQNLEISVVSAFVISLIFLIIVCFQYKKILESKIKYLGLEVKLSGFFTLVFGVFYIQYEMNRIANQKESQKRIGPLVWAIVLFGVVLPLILIINLIRVFI